MTRNAVSFWWALVVLLPVSAAAEAEPPTRVLFVGNSFTYYNNSVHSHYRQLVEEAFPGETQRIRASTISGGRLAEHHRLEALLRSEGWDVVILQGHSIEPINDVASFRHAARLHARTIRANDAEPVFFMTWAYSGRAGMTAQLDDAYSGIADELRADVAPVGLAFARATEGRPSLALRTADGRHPTLAGTYLAACVFFAVLQDRSPAALDYNAGLEPGVAAYLRNLAWQVVTDYEVRQKAIRSVIKPVALIN